MRISKLAALAMGIVLCIGALSGCGTNNTAAIDKAELEQQIKAYLDANMDSYLDK